MIQVWQKKLLFNKTQFYKEFTEDAEITLDAGLYKITMVGGGAGGIGGLVGTPGDPNQRLCAIQGGVGGTLIGLIVVRVQTSLSLIVGKGGTKGGWQGTGIGTGYKGGDTKIVGFTQGDLIAGGGTAPIIDIHRGNITPTAGVQGVNTFFSAFNVLENNKEQILSEWTIGTPAAGNRLPQVLKNLNYKPNTGRGAGGDNGWSGNVQLLSEPGGDGIIVIESGE